MATTPDSASGGAEHVVVATGAARAPGPAHVAGHGDVHAVTVLHSSEYRNGEPWRGRPVLVVGFGNSACEQAIDLVEHGADGAPVGALARSTSCLATSSA